MPASPAPGGTPKRITTATTQHFSEAQLRDIAKLVAAEMKTDAQSTLGRMHAYREEFEAAEKKKAVTAFCERLFVEGKLTPRERPQVEARLLRADARQKIQKFAENGKTVELTELDLQMRELESRPTLFRELLREPAGSAQSKDVELAKVERFSESPILAPGLAATGKTPQDFVNGFKEAQKKRPTLTAADYGVPVNLVA